MLKDRVVGNSRNGKTNKTLKNDNGAIDISVSRDRNGSFYPIIVIKFDRILIPIEDKIISMYAKEITTYVIQSYFKNFIYLAKQWLNRPLEKFSDSIFMRFFTN